MTQSVATYVNPHPCDKSACENSREILHSLSSAIHLHGDIYRIFHALTIPEFLEAWICIPCNEQNCRSFVELSGETLAVRHNCPSGRKLSIFGDLHRPAAQAAIDRLAYRQLRFITAEPRNDSPLRRI